MALLQPDFSEEVTGPAPGLYRARIANVEQTFAKSSGNPMVKWKLEVAGPSSTFTVWNTTMLAGRGVGFFRRFVEAVEPSYDGGPIDTDTLIGKTVQVELIDEYTQDGKKTGYLRVKEAFQDTDATDFPTTDVPF